MKLSLDVFRTALDRQWKSMHSVCGLPACRNTMLIRSVPQRRIGVQVGRDWYCSVDCFAAAASARLGELADERIVEMPHRPRQPIGLVMLAKDYLTGDQLRFARAQSQLHGDTLEEALLRLGLASERQLASARAAQWGCPLVRQDWVGQRVEADIPATLLHACHAVPLHYSIAGKRLVLGFVDRVEHTFLHAIERVVGCKAEPCFVTPAEFEIQMGRLAAIPTCREVVHEESLTPAQMANTLGILAVEVAAREARLVPCRAWIWTRLSGKRRTVDVLFRARRRAEAPDTENFLLQTENIGAWG